MVRWLRWHCPPDTGFEIRALAVWGRARYLSVTEAPHNTNFHTWMGKKQFCFFQTAETGNRTPDSGVKGSGANHYPRAPAHVKSRSFWLLTLSCPYDHQWPVNYDVVFFIHYYSHSPFTLPLYGYNAFKVTFRPEFIMQGVINNLGNVIFNNLVNQGYTTPFQQKLLYYQDTIKSCDTCKQWK